jgi:putative lipase involved disintegration of autophagic bodies
VNYGCDGCKVHSGFRDIYEDLSNNMLACAYTLKSNHPNAKVIITGHSLGAA